MYSQSLPIIITPSSLFTVGGRISFGVIFEMAGDIVHFQDADYHPPFLPVLLLKTLTVFRLYVIYVYLNLLFTSDWQHYHPPRPPIYRYLRNEKRDQGRSRMTIIGRLILDRVIMLPLGKE